MKRRSIPMNVFFKSQFSYRPLVRISHSCANNSKKNRLHECCLEIIYFGKESSLLCNFIEIAHRHGCSPLNLLHIFRTPFPKNTSGGLCFWHDRWTLYSYGVPHLSCLFYVMECQGISFLSLLFYYVYFVEKFTQSCF